MLDRKPIRRLLQVGLGAAGVVLVAAACGGGGGSESASPTTTAATETTATETTATETTATETSPGTSTTASGGNELDQLAQEWGTTSAKVAYSFTDSTGENGTMTLYWDPPKAWRMDITSQGERVILITNDTKTYFCTPAEKQCLSTSSGTSAPGGATVPFGPFFSGPEALSKAIQQSTGGNVSSSTRSIAGVDAQCFSQSGGGGNGEWCFSSNGVLVYARASASAAAPGQTGEFTLKATDIGDVSASDFKPPYPVQSMPNVPNIPTTTPGG